MGLKTIKNVIYGLKTRKNINKQRNHFAFSQFRVTGRYAAGRSICANEANSNIFLGPRATRIKSHLKGQLFIKDYFSLNM